MGVILGVITVDAYAGPAQSGPELLAHVDLGAAEVR